MGVRILASCGFELHRPFHGWHDALRPSALPSFYCESTWLQYDSYSAAQRTPIRGRICMYVLRSVLLYVMSLD